MRLSSREFWQSPVIGARLLVVYGPREENEGEWFKLKLASPRGKNWTLFTARDYRLDFDCVYAAFYKVGLTVYQPRNEHRGFQWIGGKNGGRRMWRSPVGLESYLITPQALERYEAKYEKWAEAHACLCCGRPGQRVFVQFFCPDGCIRNEKFEAWNAYAEANARRTELRKWKHCRELLTTARKMLGGRYGKGTSDAGANGGEACEQAG